MSTPSASWSLGRRVRRGVLGVLALLTFLIGMIAYSLADTKETGDEVVERWDPAFVTSREALDAMVNQETGVRGFALSGDEQFLEPYTRYVEVEERAVADLRSLLSDDRELMDMVDSFEAAVDDWHSTIADPVVEHVRAGDPAGAALIGSVAAKESFDAIRAASAELSGAIEQRREDSVQARERAFTRVWIAMALGTTVLLLACLWLWRGVRSVLRPIDSLAAQTRVVAGGALDEHIVPSGPSEIVELGRDVEVMRARLASQIERVEVARARLERRTAELARSNEDLEQFAYVASHDLSEPLRKVTNFGQLLERQYGDQLDDRAHQYMAYMIDGAKRMQALINDLLAFSRTGRTTQHFVQVDLDGVLSQALTSLETAIAGSGGTVTSAPLPTVPGDPTLLTALLQNLVSNAVKYRREESPPQVEIGCIQQGDSYLISVDDNGIGIDRQYAERIFTIFQRLHLRDQYGGTGIGLALCRKIVQFHGGRIWLAEKSGPGARFEFTLPVRQSPEGETDDDEPAPRDGS